MYIIRPMGRGRDLWLRSPPPTGAMWFQRKIFSNAGDVFTEKYFGTWDIFLLANGVSYDGMNVCRASTAEPVVENEFKEFVVVHFAGPVTYDASEFLEKNNDSLYANLSHMMSNSTNKIVKVSPRRAVPDRATTACRRNVRSVVTDRKRVSVVFRRLPDVQQKNTRHHDQTIQNQSEPADKHVEIETTVVHTMHQTEQLQRTRSVYGTRSANGTQLRFLTSQ